MREFKEIKGARLTTWNRGGGGWVIELSVDDRVTIFSLLNPNNKFDYN